MENIPGSIMKPVIFMLLTVACSAVCAQSVPDIILMIQEGRLAEAQNALDQLESSSRQKDSILFLKGLITKDADEAAGYYQNLIQSYPSSQFAQKALFRLAQLKYAQGLYRTALLLFLKVRDNDHQSAFLQESRYWAGLCYMAMKQSDSAVVQLRRVISEYPVREISRVAAQDLKSLGDSSPINSEEAERPADQTAPLSGVPEVTSEPGDASQKPPISFTVQVGAYSNPANAEARKQFFEGEGFTVYLSSKIQNGRTLYLVWVGTFIKEDEAREFIKSLREKYGTSSTLITNPQ
jgi:cell division septation protein DedD